MQHLAVRQVQQLDIGTPSVRAYLDVSDSEGQPLRDLPFDSISATLGEWRAELRQLDPFDSQTQGVAYVFLVDVSRSLSPALFGQVAAALEEWVDDLSALDRAALLAFGDDSKLIVDYTDDSEALQAGLSSLAPTDARTVLHQALVDALELSRRLDPDLPTRRAIVIFSDGKDEGSSITAEDVLHRFRENPAPIYALGYSRLSDSAERRRYLDLLDRFATNSGGASFAVQESRFLEAYGAIRDEIEGVWVADFECRQCRPDGTVQRLQVQIALDGKVVSDGGVVRLLPLYQAQETASAEVVTDTSTAGASRAGGVDADSGPRSDIDGLENEVPAQAMATNFSVWLMVGSVLLIAVAAWIFWRSLINRRRAEGAARLAAERISYARAPLDPEVPPRGARMDILPGARETPGRGGLPAARRRGSNLGKQSSKPGVDRPPVATKPVRLVVIRGSRQGRQYNVIVRGTAVVGHRSDCDCVLVDEADIDAQQFELHFNGIKLFIRNLSEHHPTLLNGQSIAGRAEVLSNTLVGTETTILRVVYE